MARARCQRETRRRGGPRVASARAVRRGGGPEIPNAGSAGGHVLRRARRNVAVHLAVRRLQAVVHRHVVPHAETRHHERAAGSRRPCPGACLVTARGAAPSGELRAGAAHGPGDRATAAPPSPRGRNATRTPLTDILNVLCAGLGRTGRKVDSGGLVECV